jgi:hypothetical protein
VSPATAAVKPEPVLIATRIVGVTTLVLSSTLLVPLSLAASRSTVGAAGAVVSGLLLVRTWLARATALLPAMSEVLLVPGV